MSTVDRLLQGLVRARHLGIGTETNPEEFLFVDEGRTEPHGTDQRQPRGQLVGILILRECPDLHKDLADAGGAKSDFLAGQKIGSAPCGERVCHYEYVLVVAASL